MDPYGLPAYAVLGVLAALIAGGVALFLRAPREPLARPAQPREPRVIPLVPVPEAKALLGVTLPIRACPECGYLGIRAAATGIPGAAELLSGVECPHCGYQGLPAEFDDEYAYIEYVAALHRAGRTRG